MTHQRLDRTVFQDASWWHWAVTIPLLVLHLGGVSWSLGAAATLCIIAGLYFWFRVGALKPFPVQVRIAYLVWMMIGLLPWMSWMHWIQLFGTSAMVSVGYCPLIRLLSLLPFNRTAPLTWSLVGRTFFRDPCSGGLVCWNPSAAANAACCSVATNTGSFAPTCSLAHRPQPRQDRQASGGSSATPIPSP